MPLGARERVRSAGRVRRCRPLAHDAAAEQRGGAGVERGGRVPRGAAQDAAQEGVVRQGAGLRTGLNLLWRSVLVRDMQLLEPLLWQHIAACSAHAKWVLRW